MQQTSGSSSSNNSERLLFHQRVIFFIIFINLVTNLAGGRSKLDICHQAKAAVQLNKVAKSYSIVT